MGHEDLVAIRRIIFLEIIFRDIWVMDNMLSECTFSHYV